MTRLVTERQAWIARATCGHIIAARADDGDATFESFVEWLGTSGAVSIDRTTSQAVRDEGFCPGHRARLAEEPHDA